MNKMKTAVLILMNLFINLYIMSFGWCIYANVVLATAHLECGLQYNMSEWWLNNKCEAPKHVRCGGDLKFHSSSKIMVKFAERKVMLFTLLWSSQLMFATVQTVRLEWKNLLACYCWRIWHEIDDTDTAMKHLSNTLHTWSNSSAHYYNRHHIGFSTAHLTSVYNVKDDQRERFGGNQTLPVKQRLSHNAAMTTHTFVIWNFLKIFYSLVQMCFYPLQLKLLDSWHCSLMEHNRYFHKELTRLFKCYYQVSKEINQW